MAKLTPGKFSPNISLDISHLALAHQVTVLSKFMINVPPNIANQIGPNDQNASDWFRIKQAARSISITIFSCHEQQPGNTVNAWVTLLD